MDAVLLILATAFALIFIAVAVFVAYNLMVKKPVENILMELAGELRLNYYPSVEGKPPFATGTYSGRGLTLDLLNEKGYVDRWHPHSRIVVSFDKNIKETYIVARRGRFYSRKLGEVRVANPEFESRYVFLSSSPKKAETLMTAEIASWVVAFDMPFIMSDGHIVFHQDKQFENKVRVKRIIDALVYVANVAEKIR